MTAKAIRDTLARGGVRSDEAEGVLREAEGALREARHRDATELADKAKAILRNAKLRQQRQGDLAKLEQIAAKRAPTEEEVTEKERLMKELPPNYMQSKFSMNLAQDDINAAKPRGLDTGEAERLLGDAQASFEKQDYEAALKHAVRARRALENAPTGSVPAPAQADVTAPTAKSRTCANCGASLSQDDAFCRKCGTKAPIPRTCPSCGAPVAFDDAFCRKCGATVPLKP